METPVAVLAGTPVDTQMGASFVMQAGLTACPFPLAADPRSQTAFQISSQEEKLQAVRDVLAQAQSQGCRRVFVYCNSLSSSVDFPTLACETGLRIVTPLDVYRASGALLSPSGAHRRQCSGAGRHRADAAYRQSRAGFAGSLPASRSFVH